MESINCKTRNIFQLTTSHRGRQKARPIATPSGKLFQLTTSHRGRRIYHSGFTLLRLFQLTTLTRSRSYITILPVRACQYFNSLPHTEVDFRTHEVCRCDFQFQLTTSHRGRQVIGEWENVKSKISTPSPHTEVDKTV